MKKTGFIGCGNMAQPIIKNVADKGIFERDNIFVFDTDRDKLEKFCNENGVNFAESENYIAENCDIVMLCVKPQIFPVVLPKIADAVKLKQPLIVSIAAGKTIDYIQSFFDFDVQIARIFPNLNASVGEGVFSFTGKGNVPDEKMNIVEKICTANGLAVKMNEEYFSALGVLGGCVPAYTFMFIDALAKAGVNAGLPEDKSTEIAIQTVLGSAKLLKSGIGSADEMVKKVCSPGGTTVEGVNVLEKDGLYSLVDRAFTASFEKDKILLKG